MQGPFANLAYVWRIGNISPPLQLYFIPATYNRFEACDEVYSFCLFPPSLPDKWKRLLWNFRYCLFILNINIFDGAAKKLKYISAKIQSGQKALTQFQLFHFPRSCRFSTEVSLPSGLHFCLDPVNSKYTKSAYPQNTCKMDMGNYGACSQLEQNIQRPTYWNYLFI